MQSQIMYINGNQFNKNMVFESIPKFDQYVVVAVVLFIVGLFSVMLYEKSNGSAVSSSSTGKKSEKKQQSSSGTR
ncbi:MAG TPA: hypothetical protein VFV86_10305 [Nitrososphaeraceae archaeon]|nr:hypothetical protein [Nitrososphaeraceae archaeon]